MTDRRRWRRKPNGVIVSTAPDTTVSYIFDAKTVKALFEQVVGAGSSTRFWNGLPDYYPGGSGVFIPEQAFALVSKAMERYEEIQKLPVLTIETENVLAYNDETLQKVVEALRENGISDGGILNCINSIQNRGILFRERGRD